MKYRRRGGPRDGLVMDVGDDIGYPLFITLEFATGKDPDPIKPGEELVNVLLARYKLQTHDTRLGHAYYNHTHSDQRSYELPFWPNP